ncbi:RNA-directed DNA polymerase, eukaryota [Tanacetum coccineum]
MDGWFSFICRCGEVCRTYNRPVERSGDGKPSVGSNSQSVSINENVFQSFNSYAKAVLGNKSVDMSGKYDDLYDFDGIDDVGLKICWGRWVWLEFDFMDQVESVKTSKALKEIFLEFKDVSHDFIPDERCVWIDLVGLPLASWAPEVYKKLGGRISVSPSSRVLREEDVRGVESDLVDSFEEGEIRDDSVLYNDGCIKDCNGKVLEEDAERFMKFILSDEIDSDKRMSYRDPNRKYSRVFSLAQLRSWKDYFSSDLQIWSYYGNVKEAILLHNALSRQTKDAG